MAAFVPAAVPCEITVSFSTVSDDCLTTEYPKPAPFNLATAFSLVSPVTSGTSTILESSSTVVDSVSVSLVFDVPHPASLNKMKITIMRIIAAIPSPIYFMILSSFSLPSSSISSSSTSSFVASSARTSSSSSSKSNSSLMFSSKSSFLDIVSSIVGVVCTKSTSGITRDFFKSASNSSADWYLLSGFFSVHFATILSILTGIPSALEEAYGILSCICLTATVTEFSSSKGTVPVNISKIVTPIE